MNIEIKKGILVSLVSFLAGGLATYFVVDYLSLKNRTEKSVSTSIIRKNSQSHSNLTNPFDQMDQIHSQMQKRIGKILGNSFSGSLFDMDSLHDSGFFGNNIKINRYEDGDYKYIEIAGEGVSEESMQVDITNGMISVKGEIKQIQDSDQAGLTARSSYISSFNQSFNVPYGVDETKVKIESQNNKLILKFPIDRV